MNVNGCILFLGDFFTDGETKFLLAKYSLYICDIGQGKQFRTKKEMFSRMSNDFLRELNVSKTPDQISNRL